MKNKPAFQIMILMALYLAPFGSSALASARGNAFAADAPYLSTDINPAMINMGQTAVVTVNLNNVPAEGYKSAEFTCTFDSTVLEAGAVGTSSQFGADAVVAINGPQNGMLIVAIAGSNANKTFTGGAIFTFNVKGLYPGQASINCSARISTGNDTLTSLSSFGAVLGILDVTPTAVNTAEWLTFNNLKYGFSFKYPPQSLILGSVTDTYARLNLPFNTGTNLSEKYLEVIVGENVAPCRSPLATSSVPLSLETLVINGVNFFKETGEDGSTGQIHKWIAYSTVHNNACVSLDFVLNIVNPGVFSTSAALIDETAESAVFGQIVSTYYQWLELIPTPFPTLVIPPTATGVPKSSLYGQVLAGKTVTVQVYNPDQSTAASMNTNPDGTFSFELAPGTYSIVATANGCLRAQGSVTLSNGESRSMSVIVLPAGDIDDNNSIDQFDAMTIGFGYGYPQPPGADLNNDGTINALDLELLAMNFRKTGPIPWQ